MTNPACFSVISDEFGHKSSWRLIDNLSHHTVTILPFLGGAISSFTVQGNSDTFELIDGYRTIDEIEAGVESAFKGCNLFPYPNRISGGRYRFGTKELQLPVNFPVENNAIHGLIYKMPFEVNNISESDEECSITLHYAPRQALPGYPFLYELTNTYSLSRHCGLTCTTEIINTSATSMPVGQGWHPYYSAGSASIDDLHLKLPPVDHVELDTRKLPTGNILPDTSFNDATPLADVTLDDCYRLTEGNGRGEIVLHNRPMNLELRIWQETGPGKYNYLQIYTPPEREAIAIEPMSCSPDAFNNGNGLIVLSPGETMNLRWGIHVRQMNHSPRR